MLTPKTDTSLIPLAAIFCLFLPLMAALFSYYEAPGLQQVLYLVLGLTVFGTVVRLRSTSVEDHVFPILVWSISMSLLLSYAPVSQYLSGWDIQREFAIFQQVSKTGFWNAEGGFFYNSAISISILPAIAGSVSGLGGEQVFKFVYPVLFSIVPLVLYKIYRLVLSPKSAFLSCFLFMSYWPFYMEVNSIGKMEIAELLLVLLFWVLLSGTNVKHSGAAAAILVSAGLVLSHYSTTYVCIAFVAFSIVASRITRRVVAVCTSAMIILLATLALAWYMLIAGGSALTELGLFVSTVVQGIWQDLLNPASRPLVVLQAAGLSSVTPGFLHDLFRLTNYTVQFCILGGFVVFVRKKNKSVVERKMLPLMTVALVFLGSAVILPFFGGIPFPRIYHISLLLTSVCFVLGAELLESWCRIAYVLLSHIVAVVRLPFSSRGKMTSKGLVAATILLSYFLFTSGWVWAVSLDRPTSFILDSRRMSESPDNETKAGYYSEFDVPTDVNGALWLRSYVRNGHLCSDYVSQYHVLTAYGERTGKLQSTLLSGECDSRRSLIFLSELNVVYAIGTGRTEPYGGMSLYHISIDLIAQESNRLYSNGGVVVYAAAWFG